MRRLFAVFSAVCVSAAVIAVPSGAFAAPGSVNALVLVDEGAAGSPVAVATRAVYDDAAGDTVTALPPSAGSTGLTFTVHHSDTSAVSVFLLPETGTKFVSGTTYPFSYSPTATQAELQSPALCSGLSGSLVIDSVTYTSTTITSLTAHFTGTCSGEHRSSGEIRWHSDQGYVAATATFTSITVGTGATTAFDITVTSTGTNALHTTAFTAPTGSLGSVTSYDPSDCVARTLAPGATCVVHGTATGGVSTLSAFGSARLAADVAGSDIALPMSISVINQPAAPTGLAVLPAVDGSRVVWQGLGSTTYELQRSTNGGAFADVVTGVGLNGWADTDTGPGTPVAYRVRVLSGSAQGAWATISTTSTRSTAATSTAQALVTTALDGADSAGNSLHTSGITADTDSRWSATLTFGSSPVSFATRDPLVPGTFATSDGSLRSLSMGTCGGQGSVVVRAFAIHADGTLAALDADADITACGHYAVAMRWNSATTFTAVTSSPKSVDVGDVTSGQVVAVHTVKVFNQGNASVTLGPAVFAGANENGVVDTISDWSVSDDHCAGATVAAGGSCAVTVNYDPSVFGLASGSLSYAINGGPTVAGFSLHAAVIRPPAAPTLTLQVQPGQIGVTVRPNDDDGGSAVTALRLYVGADAASLTHTTDVINGTTYWITGLHAGDHRTVSVAAVNAAGEGSMATSLAVVPSQALVYAATGTQTAPPVTGAIELRAGTQDGQPTERAVASGLWCAADTPAVSPDRTLVAYAYDDCVSSYRIAIAPSGATGTARQVGGVPRKTGWVEDPAFSPDGKTLAYTECSTAGCSLTSVPLSSGGLSGFANGAGLSRALWTPNGQSIIATSTTGSPSKLVRIPVTGGAPVTIAGTSGAMEAALSPDGTTLAFSHLDTVTSSAFTSSLWTVPVGGGAPTQVHTPSGAITYPAWAADGSGIYYERFSGSHSSIWETVNGVASLVPTRSGWDAWEPAVLSEDNLAPVVTSQVPAWVPATPSLAFTTVDRTTPSASLVVTCSLDAATPVACTSPYLPGPLVAGAHSLTVRASDPSGNVGTATAAFSVDPSAPTLPAVTATPTFAGSSVTKGTAITLGLVASDTGSGVARYEIRTRSAALGATLSAFSATSSTTASSVHNVGAGHQWCVVARSVDAAGNASAWTAQRCLLVPFDDASLSSSKWTRGAATGTFAGTVSSTPTKGATLTRSGFKGSTVLVVAKVCSTCGKLSVSVGSTSKSVTLVSSATSHWAVLSVSLGAVRSGSLVLTMTATTGRAYVDGVAWS